MKCEKCGAWTEVLETRKEDHGLTIRRTRRCANNHTFTTFEVLGPIYRRNRSSVRQTIVAAQVRAILWARNTKIINRMKFGATRREVAIEFGITDQTVSDVVLKRRRQAKATEISVSGSKRDTKTDTG